MPSTPRTLRRLLLADVTAAAVADLELLPGLDVHYVVKATEVRIYPSAA